MSTASSPNSAPWPKFEIGQPAAATPGDQRFDLSQVRAALLELQHPTVSRLETVSEDALQEALRTAGELFPGIPTIEIVCDPEAPEYPFFGITVKWCGDARGMIAQELAWARRTERLFGPFQQPRLCVVAG